MISLAERLRDEYYLMKMTPRPKPVKKPKVETAKENEKKEETASKS